MIDLHALAGRVTAPYENRVVAEVDDHVVRLSVMTGPYRWHRHPGADEAFLVLEGVVLLETPYERVALAPGQLHVVPAGVAHVTRPVGPRSANLTVERTDMTSEDVAAPAGWPADASPPTPAPPTPERLALRHAGEVLTLQRAAFASEAQLHDDPHLPPLTQSLGELEAELAEPGVAGLVLREGGRLVGTVRWRRVGDVAHVARLAVAPDRQGRGLGRLLLRAAETHAEGVRALELFTGPRSASNLRLYEQEGYVRLPPGSPGVPAGLVGLRKPRS